MPDDTKSLPQALINGLLRMTALFAQRNVRYALIGGLAASYRSQPRFTQDMDFLLSVPQLALPALLEELRQSGFSFPLEETLRAWTKDHMVVLAYQGVRVDWLKPLLPLYQHVLDRAQTEEWMGQPIRIATPEGLILTKLIAFRPQDQLDIENLLAANAGTIDIAWIRQEWETVGEKGDPHMQQFETMVQRLLPRSSP